MNKWKLISKVILLLSLLQLGVMALMPFLTPAPGTSTTSAQDPALPKAQRVRTVKDDLSLVLADVDNANSTTVRLSCLSLFPDQKSRLEAKQALINLLATSKGYVYLDDSPTATAPGETVSREVHLTTGKFVQAELAASGWVKFKPEAGCRGQETISLVSQKAQQQRLGAWQR